MRIIAGTYGGRVLSTLRDRSIRPTTDRAKQTIFDMLSARIDFKGIRVLDLFAGSGSLGLEALSRGAASVVFVENSRRSLTVLEQNIATLGCSDQCTVHQAEVFWYLKNVRQQFDLVFADPPYALERIGDLPTAIYESGVAKPGAYVVMEHSRKTPVRVPPDMYEAIIKPFGQTTVLFLKTLPHG
ncbi:MAG TPA: 16S rRNA (guanine(966)-N(2))-methyltransferase RsmD [Bacteroidota bacterium]|nr:16S rRNA (guanine(966)-N(2))-methyltransferase RsmD [Bacteroidota bacterium]